MGETKDFKVEQVDLKTNLRCSELVKQNASLVLPKTLPSEICPEAVEPIRKKVQLSCPELVKSKTISNIPRTSPSAPASIPISRGFERVRTLRRNRKPSLLGSVCRCFCKFICCPKWSSLNYKFPWSGGCYCTKSMKKDSKISVNKSGVLEMIEEDLDKQTKKPSWNFQNSRSR